ncbi:uncharacterized protein B0H18DRAFT_1120483 [Fomitopsis serialis]|uniref:uncharacterized protein n=1 Tax=Fomitopsis serialis TaxID=139415 RepID=UPI0020085A30|nr:uncharacterized protein B0H18DRAFT_1120483 [Neoantrodia serialis]KAH9923215.1 hypothetical protein B0H18DRAFT_1120483 [Neoantrodia serialis]
MAHRASIVDPTGGWFRYLKLSPSGRSYLIMAYDEHVTYEAVQIGLRREFEHEGEPLDGKKARLFFVQLPSRHYALLVKAHDPRSEAEGKFHRLILTENTFFTFTEGRATVQWLQGKILFTVQFNSSDALWTLIRCVHQARHTAVDNLGMDTIEEEVDALEARLKHLEEIAFASTLEAMTSDLDHS